MSQLSHKRSSSVPNRSRTWYGCKLCHMRFFENQSSLELHQLNDHGHKESLSVTTRTATAVLPEVEVPIMDKIPSEISEKTDRGRDRECDSTQKKNTDYSGSINTELTEVFNHMSFPSCCWGKWLDENKKLFKEFVADAQKGTEINSLEQETETDHGSLVFDFVPDYTSSDFSYPSSVRVELDQNGNRERCRCNKEKEATVNENRNISVTTPSVCIDDENNGNNLEQAHTLLTISEGDNEDVNVVVTHGTEITPSSEEIARPVEPSEIQIDEHIDSVEPEILTTENENPSNSEECIETMNIQDENTVTGADALNMTFDFQVSEHTNSDTESEDGIQISSVFSLAESGIAVPPKYFTLPEIISMSKELEKGHQCHYECGVCKKICKSKAAFDFHIPVHSIGQRFKCQLCCSGYTQTHNLKHHMRKQHGIQAASASRSTEVVAGEEVLENISVSNPEQQQQEQELNSRTETQRRVSPRKVKLVSLNDGDKDRTRAPKQLKSC